MMIMMMLLEEGVSWIAKQVQKDKKEKDPKFLFIHKEPPSLPLCSWMMMMIMILEEGVSWIPKQVQER
jgi:hypothetical protein